MKTMRNRESNQKAFTLVELVVVIAIIAILASIAIPSYTYWVKKSRKAEAKTNLSSLAVLVEEYNSLYGRYCPDCIDNNPHNYMYQEDNAGNTTAATDTITDWLDFKPKQAASGSVVRYNYSIMATSNTSYSLTATPVVTRGVLTGNITLNQDGAKTDGANNGW